ncbi:MAG: nucleotidyltransferase family protein [Acidobacteria bacterium]|nr:nucleotidyltransferase family protein [Acidobacteriota bacterium]
MVSLYEELKALVAALNHENIPYALCRGIAMAVYGLVRAPEDIDLLVQRADLDRIFTIAAAHGYTARSQPMLFEHGNMEIQQAVKMLGADEDPLRLDLLVVTPALQEVWDSREVREWPEGAICVVSRQGLIQLKSGRASGIDLEDIANLRNEDEGS